MNTVPALGLIALLVSGCGAENDFASSPTFENENNDTTDIESGNAEVDDIVMSFSALSDEQDVVAWVDLTRYVGQWYEIATTPSQQQQVCAGTKAIYSAGEDGRIDVTNQCNRGTLDGSIQTIAGYAEVVDETTNAKLEVTFFGFGAPYWVIALDGREGDQPYQWAVVSGPSDESLWLLSRNPQLDNAERSEIEAHLQGRGIDTSRLIDTAQPNPLD